MAAKVDFAILVGEEMTALARELGKGAASALGNGRFASPIATVRNEAIAGAGGIRPRRRRRGAREGLEFGGAGAAGRRTSPGARKSDAVPDSQNGWASKGCSRTSIRYQTFRAGATLMTALFIGLIIGPKFIYMLRVRQGKGQPIREDGPQEPPGQKSARRRWAG